MLQASGMQGVAGWSQRHAGEYRTAATGGLEQVDSSKKRCASGQSILVTAVVSGFLIAPSTQERLHRRL